MPATLIAPAVFSPDVYLSSNQTSYMGTTFGDGKGTQQGLIVFFINTVLPFFMMLPAVLPTIIASYSIIGEKKNRTLEPLLAAPVAVEDIMAGKAISAIVPALLATWVSAALYSIMVYIMTYGIVGRILVPDLVWAVSLLVLAPMLSFFGVMITLVISSRVNDPRTAQQVSILFVLPLMALFIGQMSGFLLLNLETMLGICVLAFVADVAALKIGSDLFDREEILTRWK